MPVEFDYIKLLQTFLSALSLIVACVAWLNSLKHAEASRRPFLRALPFKSDKDDEQVIFKNEGSGPAINTTLSFEARSESKMPHNNGAIGQNEIFYGILSGPSQVCRRDIEEGIVCFDYDDLAGKHYWSTVEMRHGMFFTDTGEGPSQKRKRRS
jgi:hypothetical protein